MLAKLIIPLFSLRTFVWTDHIPMYHYYRAERLNYDVTGWKRKSVGRCDQVSLANYSDIIVVRMEKESVVYE